MFRTGDVPAAYDHSDRVTAEHASRKLLDAGRYSGAEHCFPQIFVRAGGNDVVRLLKQA